jgi:hypothetical protein
MRNIARIVLLTVLVAAVGSMRAESPMAQDDGRRTLVGVWEGTVTRGGDTAPTRLEFSERDGGLVWTWSWQANFGDGEAEGIITKFAPPAIELSGRYTAHPLPSVKDSATSLSLILTDTWMQGRGRTTALNQAFTIAVRKK